MSKPTAVRLAGAALTAVALLGVAACGGGQGSVDELADSMAQAFNDKDTDALVDLACEADRAKAEKMKLEDVMGPALKQDFTVDVVKAEENGDSGTVTLKLTVGGKSQNEDFDVRKEDGDWTICNP